MNLIGPCVGMKSLWLSETRYGCCIVQAPLSLHFSADYTELVLCIHIRKNSIAIRVTGREGLWGCVASRISQFLDQG
jgi:hypothetical protein